MRIRISGRGFALFENDKKINMEEITEDDGSLSFLNKTKHGVVKHDKQRYENIFKNKT